MTTPSLIMPQWPAPARVRAVSTTRLGGTSLAPCDSFNLAAHVGDDPAAVAQNRAHLKALAQIPGEPAWLEQVHGTDVVQAEEVAAPRKADASVAMESGPVCVVMTADCLPVLFASRDGRRVGAAHAGWRGLAAGVLERTVETLEVAPQDLIVWFGPAIEQEHFEVGEEVRDAFVGADQRAASAFAPHRQGKWLANLYELARQRLRRLGVESVHGGDRGTYRESATFFSHRREGRCGRMATLIWIE